jgi:hypothetical protein
MLNLHFINLKIGIIIFLALAIRQGLILYLNKSNGYENDILSYEYNIQFILHYDRKVKSSDEGYKKLCNILLQVFKYALCTFLFLSILQYLVGN